MKYLLLIIMIMVFGYLPCFTQNSNNAPVISMANATAFPNETLVMTGFNLKNSCFNLKCQETERVVSPVMTDTDKAMVVIPADFPNGIIEITPINNKIKGKSYTINSPEVWWQFPTAINLKNSTIVSLYGRNLKLKECDVSVKLLIKQKKVNVDIVEINPYMIKIKLPVNLNSGQYGILISTSEGDKEVLVANVIVSNKISERNEKIYSALNYGAIPNDSIDDSKYLQNAINAIGIAGGGVLNLDRGTYIFSTPLRITYPNITIKGIGRGVYNKESQIVEGDFTLLTFCSKNKFPSDLIRVEASNVKLFDFSVINGNTGNKENAIGIYGNKANLDNLLLVLKDKRDWGFEKEGPVYGVPNTIDRSKTPNPINECGALYVDSYGILDMTFKNSEVHSAGPGMLMGKLAPTNLQRKTDAEISSVKVDSVNFFGYYTGEPYGFGNSSNVGSGRSAGIILFNARNMSVEHCTFQSANRSGGRYLGRSVLSLNTSNTNLHFAHNVSTEVGPHSSVRNIDPNQGEQYLFHYRYPHGGMFTVNNAEHNSVIFDKGDYRLGDEEPFAGSIHFIDDKYSRVLDEVGQNENWYVYVFKGKGVGQYRKVVSKDLSGNNVKLKLDKPWLVLPDTSSKIHLTALYRHITLFRNEVDTKDLIKEYKSHGVTFWFYSFENIIAENTFKNVTSAIVFNSHYRGETAWNLTTGNKIENVYGYSGDTSLEPSGYCDHFRIMKKWPDDKFRGWYEVGNVARNNTFNNVKVAAFLHGRYETNDSNRPFAEHTDGGIVMGVIENNTFTNVDKGIVIGNPAHSCLIRNNIIKFSNNAENLTPIIMENLIKSRNYTFDNQIRY
jgi:hypothetical protein